MYPWRTAKEDRDVLICRIHTSESVLSEVLQEGRNRNSMLNPLVVSKGKEGADDVS